MGQAIINGLLSNNVMSRGKIYIYDIKPAKISRLVRKYGISRTGSYEDMLGRVDIVVLAVKPQDSVIVFEKLRGHVDSRIAVLSIMAGIRISKIGAYMEKDIDIARAMPNMGALIGRSVSAVSFSRGFKKVKKDYVKRILGSIGNVYEMRENMLDAVTALSGSGPAYFFYIVESMMAAAREYGFSEDLAREIVLGTMEGSSELLRSTGSNAKELRDRVTSKGGTTAQAIRLFEESGLRDIIARGIEAARARAKELS